MYSEQQVCQKHYFRFMRNGTYEIVRKSRARLRYQDPAGYWKVYEPNHPLADRTGYVWEHRKIVYDRIGDSVPPCELCAKPLTWKTAHVDHIDEDPSNNDPGNLRPLCCGCNTWRGSRIPQHEAKGHHAITFGGETKTPNEWARDPRVKVSNGTIVRRKKAGASDYEALFGEKRTHNGNLPRPEPRKTQFKYERSNAIALTINGVTKTAMEWSREPGCTVTDGAIRFRVRQGWPHDKAVFAPPRAMKDRGVTVVRNSLGRFESTAAPKSGD